MKLLKTKAQESVKRAIEKTGRELGRTLRPNGEGRGIREGRH